MRGAVSEEEVEATGVAGTATLRGGSITNGLGSLRRQGQETYGDKDETDQQQLEKPEPTRSRRDQFATSSCWAPSAANQV